MHCLTKIQFALVLRKIQFTLDDKLHFCGICIVMVVELAVIEVGATRDSSRLLSELRFHVVGHFTRTTEKAVEDTITRLGGSTE